MAIAITKFSLMIILAINTFKVLMILTACTNHKDHTIYDLKNFLAV